MQCRVAEFAVPCSRVYSVVQQTLQCRAADFAVPCSKVCRVVQQSLLCSRVCCAAEFAVQQSLLCSRVCCAAEFALKKNLQCSATEFAVQCSGAEFAVRCSRRSSAAGGPVQQESPMQCSRVSCSVQQCLLYSAAEFALATMLHCIGDSATLYGRLCCTALETSLHYTGDFAVLQG